jgi:hypothetical protein
VTCQDCKSSARPPVTGEGLAVLYERLTGRKMTPEELVRAEKRLAEK